MAATNAELKSLIKMMGRHRSEIEFSDSRAIEQLHTDRCLEIRDGVILATEKGQMLIGNLWMEQNQ